MAIGDSADRVSARVGVGRVEDLASAARMKKYLIIALAIVPFWAVAYLEANDAPYDFQVIYPYTLTRVGHSNAYWAELIPAVHTGDPDTLEHPDQSEMQLTENGVLLGPAHSAHAEIESLGNGRYSHWSSGRVIVMFSASDNSDPRTNGRVYRITDPSVGR